MSEDKGNNSRNLPLRFWMQSALAALSAVLFVLTLITREWVEALTGFEPDNGNGTFEFALAIALFALSVLTGTTATRTYRRVAVS